MVEFPSTKVLVSAAAAVTAIRGYAGEFIPWELKRYFRDRFYKFIYSLSNEISIIIEEFDGLRKNDLFYAAESYAASLSAPTLQAYRAFLPDNEKKIQMSIGGNEEMFDHHKNFVGMKNCSTNFVAGIHLQWRSFTEKSSSSHLSVPPPAMGINYDDFTLAATPPSNVRCFKITFHKKHKAKVVDDLLKTHEALKGEMKTLKLHTLISGAHPTVSNPWQSVNLDHPATFETLAMDDEMKNTIIDDLDLFLKRREFYRKVGKAWKRGYLLFGPPGTGKSSLIAAIANYLNFDVYDLELTDIRSNSELSKLVIKTANRSILVVEDIDASIDLSERTEKKAANPPMAFMSPYALPPQPKVTLSGLLNFIDGLWSSVGDERIIIFTTNHKEKLDPALLRPGRMDMHIHMSYCTPCGFKLLASNYLGIRDHPLALKAAELIASSEVTPAEVGEHLLRREDPELALAGLIDFLQLKKEAKSSERPVPETNKSSTYELKDLMKMVEDLPPGTCENILKMDEAADAMRSLIELIRGMTGYGSELSA